MMDLSQKIPMARSLNRVAEKRAADLIQLLGKALPAEVTAVSGSIVTVKFLIQSSYNLPKVTLPAAGSEYIRVPLQVGNLGAVFPADTFLGGVTGLGSGVASLTMPANLSSLVYFPLGNKNWTAPENPRQLELYGPDGVLLKNANRDFVVQVTSDGVRIQKQDGSVISLVMDGDKTTFKGPVWFENIVFMKSDLALFGGIFGLNGLTYDGDIMTTGEVVARSGLAQVSLTTHTHPPANNPPNPGT